MFDMVTPTYKAIIADIDEDIERLNTALAIVSDIRANKRRDNDDRLESAIRGIGGEIAWLQSKRLEAEKYLSEEESHPPLARGEESGVDLGNGMVYSLGGDEDESEGE